MTRADREKELYALLHSGVVRERTQLRTLLEYLGNKAIDAPEEALKEHTIGVEALSKPPGYDPRIDPSVRVEVGKLRQKIAEYYRGAGTAHPIRLEIPKGTYMPVYVEAPVGVGAGGRRLVWKRWGVALAAAGVVAAGLMAGVLETRLRHRLAAETEMFWAPHFDGTPTLLVYGAPLFLKVQGSFFRNPDVNRPEGFDEDPLTRRLLGALEPKEIRPVHTFTGVGEAEALFHLTQLLASRGAELHVSRSDTVGVEDLRRGHAIILGGRKYNPQLLDLPFKPKFEAVNRRIVNLRPGPGEPAEYRTGSNTSHGEITEEYSLISVYPGLKPGSRLVTLECSSTEGTLAAAEFLTRADLLRALEARGVPLQPERGAYRAFQVVIGAKFARGVVVDLFYKTHQVLP